MSTASHPSDEDTAEACADCARLRRCGPCFEELVRRFETPLLHFLTRRVGSRHDAEDLLQETFFVAYRKLHTYRSAWRFGTWVFTIANRLAVSSRRRRRLPGVEAGRFVEPVSGPNPLAVVEGNELRQGLWGRAQGILNPDAFVAVWLNYVELMPAEEIGLVLGRSPNAVRILLCRARATLARELGSVWEVLL